MNPDLFTDDTPQTVDPAAAEAFRQAGPAGKWLADLYLLASRRLDALGVASVHGGDACTFTVDIPAGRATTVAKQAAQVKGSCCRGLCPTG